VSLSNTLFVATLRAHEFVYVHSDGWLGHHLLGVSTLLLRTTGRRTGQTRTNALVYAKDSDRYLVVPSNGGADKPPAWLLNLQAEPSVEIQLGRDRKRAAATVIERGDADFDRLWKLVNDRNGHRYDAYQRKTERQIPVVALAPR
jgi:deazaflavin-dependent oxidoreductase (nitroreductase family)